MSARLAAVARETVRIVRAGEYRTPSGARIDIREDVARAVAGTRLYLPDDDLPGGDAADGDLLDGEPSTAEEPGAKLTVHVSPVSTLAAGRHLGRGTAALVFASARNPGGGFLNGAKAQEEDVARSSALYECLLTAGDFYAHHRADRDLRYSDRVIYCPEVPVFRDDDGALLEQPYGLSLIVAAAPNLGAIMTNQPDLAGTVPAVLNRRAERILRVARAHGHRQIVLGAWGCGVFRNPPEIVANAFIHALTRVPGFQRVVFAILDRTGEGPAYQAFAAAVASWARAASWTRSGSWTQTARGPNLRFWACLTSGPCPDRRIG